MPILGPGRDKELGISKEQIKERASKLTRLESPVHDLAMYVAEGQSMTEGYHFMTGMDLAAFLMDTILFSVVVLMEQGYINKQLPKKAAIPEKKEEDGTRGYV